MLIFPSSISAANFSAAFKSSVWKGYDGGTEGIYQPKSYVKATINNECRQSARANLCKDKSTHESSH
ncbi:hypothetical protein LENED_009349 [Lentinula edodes]|uniref:Uncharacterized protein n=1 Tax=Lentinula edodes TaxID=5353 RepID=A0A1Q3EJI0_LENED|nr:hypothetical protein LENED_009349 [Lentinula edodes]